MANKGEKLSPKEKAFADDYLETGNATRSALKVYDTEDPNTAGVIGHSNLRKAKIQHYLENEVEEVKKNMLHLALNAEQENVQVSAGKDVLDRALGKAQQHIDHSTMGQPLVLSFDNSFNDDSTTTR